MTRNSLRVAVAILSANADQGKASRSNRGVIDVGDCSAGARGSGPIPSIPAAWAPRLSKVKPPLDFMGSALRALGVAEAAVSGLDFPAFRLTFFVPMSLMFCYI